MIEKINQLEKGSVISESSVRTDKESGIRPVNINTIKYLIFDGVKYVVK